MIILSLWYSGFTFSTITCILTLKRHVHDFSQQLFFRFNVHNAAVMRFYQATKFYFHSLNYDRVTEHISFAM